ncbi:MAG: HAMP domain-containing sensor histidine kinase [Acidocella sp.]|nr:HAMP domain-containing sensor histidine kinase [Acidocella sp.]
MINFKVFARLRQANGFDLFSSSLSARVLWLTVSIILLVELVILMPSLGRERQAWLWDHVTLAHLAVASGVANGVAAQDGGPMQALLKLSDIERVQMSTPGGLPAVVEPGPPGRVDERVYLPDESLLSSMWQADLLVLGLGPKRIELIAASPLQNDVSLDIVVNGRTLAASLREYTEHIAGLSVIVALVTGLLVFAALDRLLVRPMRIITANIVGFREDPERAGETDLSWLAHRRNDEISEAARQLKSMQDEMRAALWRNARLAALGTSVAKISHDLRNILSSALLVADRLQSAPDPVTQSAAGTLISVVERAAELVSRTVDFAREGPPAIMRSAVPVAALVAEAAAAIRTTDAGVTVENHVPENLILALDRAQIFRVLINLVRNAVEAGADLIEFTVDHFGGVTRLKIRDNGPGLPLRVQDKLFMPFAGSGRRGGTGLGLAIARDLIRAHGGDLVLADTGPRGTMFVMDLATSELQGESAGLLKSS